MFKGLIKRISNLLHVCNPEEVYSMTRNAVVSNQFIGYRKEVVAVYRLYRCSCGKLSAHVIDEDLNVYEKLPEAVFSDSIIKQFKKAE